MHAVHLGSYLRGEDGKALAEKAAAGLGLSRDAFMSLVESGRELELVMPRVLDRVAWDGAEDLDVAATQSTWRERHEARHISETGYDITGRPTRVKTLAYSARPYLIVRPAEHKFPNDPERLRLRAPKHTWSTVTTPAQERAQMREHGRMAVAAAGQANDTTLTFHSARNMIIQCGDPGAPPDCDDPPPPPPPPPGVGGGGAVLPSTMTKSYCYTVSSSTDHDNDQIRDDCEAALASRLAPLLNIGNDDWVSARQPYWAISRNPDRPDNVQIFFAVAYLRDGGFSEDFYADSQEGDSEFIILEVINSVGSTWGIIGATLSAHFDAEMDDCYYIMGGHYCGTDSYYWDDLDYPQGPYPRIWSSLGKHANYRNRAACESGADTWDSCGGDFVGGQILAPSTRNLGNYYNVPAASRNVATQLINCTLWEGSSYMYGWFRTGQECFWDVTNDRFSGWDPMRPDPDATPYWRIFEIFGV